jgi:CPA2 family monovalent cation:H+ antiporter-2
VGLGLAQIGEFSVIVAVEAGRLGLLDEATRELFLAVAVPTLIATPFLMRAGCRLGRRDRAVGGDRVTRTHPADHVVIIGFGINGRNVARALRLLKVPHVVIDLNPYTVETLLRDGGLALEGDARHREVLEAVAIERARGVVVTLPDAVSTREVVALARGLNPAATILARTRYLREVEALAEHGADQVIPEEFETSLELTGRVLELYGAPPHVVEKEKASLRREGYGLLRGAGATAPHPTLEILCRLPGVTRLKVAPDAPVSGRSLAELDLRRSTGATILAVERKGTLITNPRPDEALAAGDELIAFADGEALKALLALVRAGDGK